MSAVEDCSGLEVDDDDRVGPERVVGDAARLDRHHARIAVGRARVSEGERDKTGIDKCAVRLADVLSELGVSHQRPRAR